MNRVVKIIGILFLLGVLISVLQEASDRFSLSESVYVSVGTCAGFQNLQDVQENIQVCTGEPDGMILPIHVIRGEVTRETFGILFPDLTCPTEKRGHCDNFRVVTSGIPVKLKRLNNLTGELEINPGVWKFTNR